MLDQTIIDRARGLIHPAIQLRRGPLHAGIQRVLAEMSARGLANSSMTIDQVFQLCQKELRDRTLIVWDSLQKVHSLLGARRTDTLAADLKHQVEIYCRENNIELTHVAEPIIANTGVAGFARQFSLDDAEMRVEAEVAGLVDLYVEALAFTTSTAPSSDEPPLVFISCGQYTTEEIEIGKTLAKMVDDKLAPCRGYFAQNQTSLDGLSRNIFGALHRCVGFIAVMHHRGAVATLYDTHTRASVWIEQELAIAAFLTQAQQRPLAVAAYIQKGIKREGVREQLHLNPMEFEIADDILRDLEARITNGSFRPDKR